MSDIELLAMQMVQAFEEDERKKLFRGPGALDKLRTQITLSILHTLHFAIPDGPMGGHVSNSTLPESWRNAAWQVPLSDRVGDAIKRFQNEPQFHHLVRSLQATIIQDIDRYLGQGCRECPRCL